MAKKKENILVTGTTGYVGGRLVPKLLEADFSVRILTREPTHLNGRKWQDQVEVFLGDRTKAETCISALENIDVVFYMTDQKGDVAYNSRETIESARIFSKAAKNAGVRRIICLGWIETESGSEQTSQQSRMWLGDAMRASGISVIELRASIIMGSGSLFFEMIRHLAEKLPVMLLPKSFSVKLHPIAIHDVLAYLIRSVEVEEPLCQAVDIGLSNEKSLHEMLSAYADIRELKRWFVLVPIIPDWVAAFWINFITPIPIEVARPLIKEIQREKVKDEQCAKKYFPDIQPSSFEESVKLSLEYVKAGVVETSWSDALTAFQSDEGFVDMLNREGIVYERRYLVSPAPVSAVFNVIQRLGGTEGWLFFDWAWKMRGFMDRLTGGVGLQRGRRTPADLRVGDALDFWRVEAILPNKLLRLRAEMKVPGQAWLEFETAAVDEGHTSISLVAFFHPKGLTGLAYWYMLYPIHKILFTGMIQKISEKSLQQIARS